MKRVPIDKNIPGQLYDMEKDVFEEKNLYTEHPEVVSTMTALLESLVHDGRSTPGGVQNNDVPVKIK